MDGETITGILALLVGLLVTVAAGVDADWWMAHGQSQRLIGWFGRTAARVIWVVLGIAVTAYGIALLMGAM